MIVGAALWAVRQTFVLRFNLVGAFGLGNGGFPPSMQVEDTAANRQRHIQTSCVQLHPDCSNLLDHPLSCCIVEIDGHLLLSPAFLRVLTQDKPRCAGFAGDEPPVFNRVTYCIFLDTQILCDLFGCYNCLKLSFINCFVATSFQISDCLMVIALCLEVIKASHINISLIALPIGVGAMTIFEVWVHFFEFLNVIPVKDVRMKLYGFADHVVGDANRIVGAFKRFPQPCVILRSAQLALKNIVLRLTVFVCVFHDIQSLRFRILDYDYSILLNSGVVKRLML